MNQQVTNLPLRNCNVPHTNARILIPLNYFRTRKRVSKIRILNALKYRMTQKKRELLKNRTKIEEIKKKLLTEIETLQLAF